MKIDQNGLETYKKLLVTAAKKFVVVPCSFHLIESRHDCQNR
jgi:hypothetical protein